MLELYKSPHMKSITFHKYKWRKQLLMLNIFLHFFICHIIAQVPAISRVEYFIDTDPGYGNAINLGFVGTTDATAAINIDLTALAQGVHIVGVRSKDVNNAWSLDNKWLFVKPYSSSVILQPNINRVEWYLDADPGYGNGTALSIVAAQDLAGLFFNIDLLPLSQGVHIAGVRSRDANGAWSMDNKWLFVKPYSSSAILQPAITRVEWYLDTDPGFGNGTALPISSAQDLAGLSFNIDMLPLAQGVHIVGIRSKDANGAWSLDNKWLFVKPYSSSVLVQPNITRVEWYLDTDPGYGNGNALSISAGQDLAGLFFNIDMIPLSQGVHIVGVRSKDANAAWSLDNKWIFLKPYNAGGVNPVPNIVRMEYYVDVDPGYGNAASISITPGTDVAMLLFDANISAVSAGAHKLGIRSLDANGAWSIDNKVDFTKLGGISWVGVTSTAWNTPSNWSNGQVPTLTDDITIPFGTPFPPVVANGVTANCKTVQLNTGVSITVQTGGILKVGQ